MAKLQSGTRIYGTANVDTILYVNTYAVVNATGIYTTGVVNASSLQVGSTDVINATGVYTTGTMNSSSYTVGTSFTANSTVVNAAANVIVGNILTVGNSTINTFSNSTHFFSGNSTYYGFGNSVTDALVSPTGNLILTPTSVSLSNSSAVVFSVNTTVASISGIPLSANGSNGTASWVLTSNGSIGSPYWAAASGGGSVNTANQYVFTNTITFNANLSVNGAIFLGGSNGQVGQVLTSNGTGNAYWSTVSGGGGGSFTNGASIAVSNIAYTNATGTSTGIAYQFINTVSGSLDTVFS